MRILHISTRLILGGSQENTVLSCEGQARRGHDVHLAFGPIYGPEGSLLDRVKRFRVEEDASTDAPARVPSPPGADADDGDPGPPRAAEPDARAAGASVLHIPGTRGITTHLVPHLVRAVNPIADWRCSLELKRLIRELRPDIVHTHSSKAGILGRAAAWRVNAELVRHASRGRAREAGGAGPPRGAAPAGIVHTIHGPPFHAQQAAPVNAAYVLAERFAARRCHVIVGVADAMAREFLDERIGDFGQYVTVYSGMETGAFLHPRHAGESRDAVRRELGLAESDFVIGTVARLADLKGHDDILTALAEDLPREPTWKLLWVGDGWRRDRLLARVRAMGLAQRVITTGLVPPERVAPLMRAMDVLVHASLREGLPRTVPQALLCGVMPIAYDVDGTREACRELETGRLVPARDLPALRRAVRWAFDEPLARRALAERGRAECAERFSAERMIDELEKVYRRALAAARGGDAPI